MLLIELQEHIDYQVALVMCEARTGFDMRTFKTIETTQEMEDYAGKFLTRLGTGSSRVVFMLNTRHVLKIARSGKSQRDSGKGLAQNEAEVSVFTSPATKPVVAKIYDFDSNYRWLVSEVVRELKNGVQFEEATGMNFSRFCQVIDDLSLGITLRYKEEIERLKQKLADDDFSEKYRAEDIQANIDRYQEFLSIIANPLTTATGALVREHKLGIGDIMVAYHWGKTADGRVVLLDYGYTQDVMNKFY